MPSKSNSVRNALRGFLHSNVPPSTDSSGGPTPEWWTAGGTGPRRSGHLLYRMAVHEASHAVIRLYLGLGTITKITINAPEGGHITWRTDELDEQTEAFFAAALEATLAGRAGEEVIIKSVAANGGGDCEASDCAVATQIAFAMETAMGFGQKWPLLYRATDDPQFLLARDAELAGSVHARLNAAYAAARNMVAKQFMAIMHLANALVIHGTLEGSELEDLLASTEKLIIRE